MALVQSLGATLAILQCDLPFTSRRCHTAFLGTSMYINGNRICDITLGLPGKSGLSFPVLHSGSLQRISWRYPECNFQLLCTAVLSFKLGCGRPLLRSKVFVSPSLGQELSDAEKPQLATDGDDLQLDVSVFEETFRSIQRVKRPVGAHVKGLPIPESTLIPDDWKAAKEYFHRSKKERKKETLALQLNAAKKRALEERATRAELENRQKFLGVEEFTSEDVTSGDAAVDELQGRGVLDRNPGEEACDSVFGSSRPKDYCMNLKSMSFEDIARALKEEEAEARKMEAEHDLKMQCEDSLLAVEGENITLTAEENATLQNKNMELTVISSEKWSPLHTLAASGQIYLVVELLKRDVLIDSLDNEGFTPLQRAVQGCQKNMIRLLIRAGANVHVVDKGGASLLHYSAQMGNHEISKLLLRHGVDVNLADRDGWTPLHVAVQSGRFELIRALVYRGANITSPNKDSRTPLDLALTFGRCFNFYEAIKFLKEHSACSSLPMHNAQ